MSSQTIVFFGNERLATGVTTTAPTARALLRSGYKLAAIVTHYQPGTSRSNRQLEIAEVAKEHNIPLLLPNRPLDIKDHLASLDAQAAVLVAYGQIIPQTIIDIFPCGIVNIHPSLLPLHRGPTPIESVILDGSKQTGVSIMQLSQKMDAGPVFGQSPLNLSGQESKQELSQQLLKLGGALLLDLLPAILAGKAKPRVQHDAKATYDQLLTKQAGLIDWSKPATQLEREIRAYLGWPGSHTKLANRDVSIIEARPVRESTKTPLKLGEVAPYKDQLLVQTAQGWLQILRLQPAGKKPISGADFVRGYLKNLK